MEELKQTPQERHRFINKVLALSILVLFAVIVTLIYIYWYPTTKVYLRDCTNNSIIQSYEMKKNSKLLGLPTPNKEGYSFGGWYSDIECQRVYDIQAPLTVDSLSLYAKFTKKIYEITFIVSLEDGDNSQLFEKKLAEYGTSYSVPTLDDVVGLTSDEATKLFHKPGFEFCGWTPSKFYTSDFVPASEVIPINGSYTVKSDSNKYYATWKSKSYNLDYYIGVKYNKVNNLAVKEDGIFKYQNYTDFTFARNEIRANNEYIVKHQPFVANLELLSNMNLSDDTAYGLYFDSKASSLYDFISWNPDKQLLESKNFYNKPLYLGLDAFEKVVIRLENNEVIANESIEKPNTINLYSTWKFKQYNLTFNKNNDNSIGTMELIEFTKGNQLLFDIGLSEMFTIKLPMNTFTLASSKFVKWTISLDSLSKFFNDGQTFLNMTYDYDLTLYANWDQIYYITVTNGLTGKDLAFKKLEQGYVSGEYVTLPCANEYSWQREGYDFKNWASRGPFNITVEGNAQFLMPSSDIAFDATWEGTKIVINYVGNGGSFSGKTEIKLDGVFNYGKLHILKENTFINKSEDLINPYEYRFLGWSLVDPKLPIYDKSQLKKPSDGVAIKPTTNNENTMYIFAVWIKQYSIQFDLNGGVGIIPEKIVLDDGVVYNLMVLASNYTNAGAIFCGWRDGYDNDYRLNNSNPESQSIYLVTMNKDYKMKAIWSASIVNVTYYVGGKSLTASWQFGKDLTPPIQTSSSNSFALLKEGYNFFGWNKKNEQDVVSNVDILGLNVPRNVRESIKDYTWDNIIVKQGLKFESMNLYPVYAIKQFDVTFNNMSLSTGNTLVKTASVKYGYGVGSLEWPSDQVLAAKKFDGWFLGSLDSSNNVVYIGQKYTPNTVIKLETTLYAKFSDRVYDIVFHYNFIDLNGVSHNLRSDYVAANIKEGLPANTLKEYYAETFIINNDMPFYSETTYGFNYAGMNSLLGKNESFSGDIVINTTNFPTNADGRIHLCANWTKKTIKVYFSNSNPDSALENAEIKENKLITYKYGDTFTLPNTVESIDGSAFMNFPITTTFGGWSKKKGDNSVITSDIFNGKQYQIETISGVLGEVFNNYKITYYAIWKGSYKLEYYSDDTKTSLISRDPSNVSDYFNRMSTPNLSRIIPQNVGYSFVGWEINGTNSTTNETKTIRYEITENGWNKTIKLVGGLNPGTSAPVYIHGEVQFAVGDLDNTKYFAEKSANGEYYSYKFYSIWKIEKYSITYQYDNPTIAGIDYKNIKVDTFDYNTEITLPSRSEIELLGIVPEGYYFDCWEIAGHNYSNLFLMQSNVVANALIKEQHTLTYNYNRFENDTGSRVVKFSPFNDITILDLSNEAVKAGYTLLGFSTNKTDKTASYLANANVKFTTDTILYAIYSANIIKVTFDKNGGVFAGAGANYGVNIAVDSTLTLPNKDESRTSKTGYALIGWEKNLTNFSIGQKIPITATDTNILYSAIWEKVYTVQFKYESLDKSINQTTEVNVIEDKIYDVTIPTDIKTNITITEPTRLAINEIFKHYSYKTFTLQNNDVTALGSGLVSSIKYIPIEQGIDLYLFNAITDESLYSVEIEYHSPVDKNSFVTNLVVPNGKTLVSSLKYNKTLDLSSYLDDVTFNGFKLTKFSDELVDINSLNYLTAKTFTSVKITGNIIIYAYWQSVVSVSYFGGDFSNSDLSSSTEIKLSGENFSIKDLTSIIVIDNTLLSNAGKIVGKYKLAGYSINKNGSTLDYTIKQNITLNNNLALYPYWVKEYKLRFTATESNWNEPTHQNTTEFQTVGTFIGNLTDYISNKPINNDGAVLFSGWTKMLGGAPITSYSINSEDDLDKDDIIEFYSVWNYPSYKVTVINNNQSSIYTMGYKANITINNTNKAITINRTTIVPEKVGYKFDGWYSDKTLANKYVFPYIVNKDITIYANYLECFEIRVDICGGELLTGKTLPVFEKMAKGDTLSSLPIPSDYAIKIGYHISNIEPDSWYILNGNRNKNVNDTFTLTEDMLPTSGEKYLTLKINWVPDNITIKIKYAKTELEYNTPTFINEVKAYNNANVSYTQDVFSYNSKIYLPNHSQLRTFLDVANFNNFTLIGWTDIMPAQNKLNLNQSDCKYLIDTNNLCELLVESNLTLYPVFSSTTDITIKFICGENGELSYVNGADTVPIMNGTPKTFMVNYNGSSKEITAKAKIGFDFLGWTENNIDFIKTNPLIVNNITSNREFTAVFNRRDIKINVNFIQINAFSVENSVNIKMGSVTKLFTPTETIKDVNNKYISTVSYTIPYYGNVLVSPNLATLGFKQNYMKLLNGGVKEPIPLNLNDIIKGQTGALEITFEYEVEQIKYIFDINLDGGKFIDQKVYVGDQNADLSYTYSEFITIANTESTTYKLENLVANQFVDLSRLIPSKNGYQFKSWQENGIDCPNNCKIEGNKAIIATWTKLHTVTYKVMSSDGVNTKTTNIISFDILDNTNITINKNSKGDDIIYKSGENIFVRGIYDMIGGKYTEYTPKDLLINGKEFLIENGFFRFQVNGGIIFNERESVTISNDTIIKILDNSKKVKVIYYDSDSKSKIVNPVDMAEYLFETLEAQNYPYLNNAFGDNYQLQIYNNKNSDIKEFVGWNICSGTNSISPLFISKYNSQNIILNTSNLNNDEYLYVYPTYANIYTIKYNIGVGNTASPEIKDGKVIDYPNRNSANLTTIKPVNSNSALLFNGFMYNNVVYDLGSLFILNDTTRPTSNLIIEMVATYKSIEYMVTFKVTNPSDSSIYPEDISTTFYKELNKLDGKSIPKVLNNTGANLTIGNDKISNIYTNAKSDYFYQHKFLGWGIDKLGSIVVLDITGLNADTTYYSIWETQYFVEYSILPTDTVDGIMPEKMWYSNGSIVNIAKNTITRANNRFLGFVDETDAFIASDTITISTKNYTLRPKFAKEILVTINLNNNWADTLSGESENTTITNLPIGYSQTYINGNHEINGVKLIIGEKTGINTLFNGAINFTMNHFSFIGYSLVPQTANTNLTDNLFKYTTNSQIDSISFNKDNDVTLYGVWEKKNYTINCYNTYLLDGEPKQIGTTNDNIYSLTVPYLFQVNNLSSNIIGYSENKTSSAPYYKFENWYTSYNQTIPEYELRFLNPVIFSGENITCIKQNTNLYAKGKRLYKTTYNIPTDGILEGVVDGEITGNDNFSFVGKNLTTKLPKILRSGYTLSGFNVEIKIKNGTRKQVFVINQDVTILGTGPINSILGSNIIFYKNYNPIGALEEGRMNAVYGKKVNGVVTKGNGIIYENETFYMALPGENIFDDTLETFHTLPDGDEIVLTPIWIENANNFTLVKPKFENQNNNLGLYYKDATNKKYTYLPTDFPTSIKTAEVKVLPNTTTNIDLKIPNYDFCGWSFEILRPDGNASMVESDGTLKNTGTSFSIVNKLNKLYIRLFSGSYSYDLLITGEVNIYAIYRISDFKVEICVDNYKPDVDKRTIGVTLGALQNLKNMSVVYEPSTLPYYKSLVTIVAYSNNFTGQITATTKEGFTFDGWYLRQDAVDTKIGNTVTFDIGAYFNGKFSGGVIVAKYTTKTYKVTLTGTQKDATSLFGIYSYTIDYYGVKTTEINATTSIEIDNIKHGSTITYSVTLDSKYSNLVHLEKIILNGRQMVGPITDFLISETITISAIYTSNVVNINYNVNTTLSDPSVGQQVKDAYTYNGIINTTSHIICTMPNTANNWQISKNNSDVTLINNIIRAYNGGDYLTLTNPNFSLTECVSTTYVGKNGESIDVSIEHKNVVTINYIATNGTMTLYESELDANNKNRPQQIISDTPDTTLSSIYKVKVNVEGSSLWARASVSSNYYSFKEFSINKKGFRINNPKPYNIASVSINYANIKITNNFAEIDFESLFTKDQVQLQKEGVETPITLNVIDLLSEFGLKSFTNENPLIDLSKVGYSISTRNLLTTKFYTIDSLSNYLNHDLTFIIKSDDDGKYLYTLKNGINTAGINFTIDDQIMAKIVYVNNLSITLDYKDSTSTKEMKYISIKDMQLGGTKNIQLDVLFAPNWTIDSTKELSHFEDNNITNNIKYFNKYEISAEGVLILKTSIENTVYIFTLSSDKDIDLGIILNAKYINYLDTYFMISKDKSFNSTFKNDESTPKIDTITSILPSGMALDTGAIVGSVNEGYVSIKIRSLDNMKYDYSSIISLLELAETTDKWGITGIEIYNNGGNVNNITIDKANKIVVTKGALAVSVNFIWTRTNSVTLKNETGTITKTDGANILTNAQFSTTCTSNETILHSNNILTIGSITYKPETKTGYTYAWQYKYVGEATVFDVTSSINTINLSKDAVFTVKYTAIEYTVQLRNLEAGQLLKEYDGTTATLLNSSSVFSIKYTINTDVSFDNFATRLYINGKRYEVTNKAGYSYIWQYQRTQDLSPIILNGSDLSPISFNEDVTFTVVYTAIEYIVKLNNPDKIKEYDGTTTTLLNTNSLFSIKYTINIEVSFDNFATQLYINGKRYEPSIKDGYSYVWQYQRKQDASPIILNGADISPITFNEDVTFSVVYSIIQYNMHLSTDDFIYDINHNPLTPKLIEKTLNINSIINITGVPGNYKIDISGEIYYIKIQGCSGRYSIGGDSPITIVDGTSITVTGEVSIEFIHEFTLSLNNNRINEVGYFNDFDNSKITEITNIPYNAKVNIKTLNNKSTITLLWTSPQRTITCKSSKLNRNILRMSGSVNGNPFTGTNLDISITGFGSINPICNYIVSFDSGSGGAIFENYQVTTVSEHSNIDPINTNIVYFNATIDFEVNGVINEDSRYTLSGSRISHTTFNGELIGGGDMFSITGDSVISVIYIAKPTYTVNLYNNGTMDNITSFTVSDGDTLKVSDNSGDTSGLILPKAINVNSYFMGTDNFGINKIRYNGISRNSTTKRFMGWATSPPGNVISSICVRSNISLFAKWEDVIKTTIQLNVSSLEPSSSSSYSYYNANTDIFSGSSNVVIYALSGTEINLANNISNALTLTKGPNTYILRECVDIFIYMESTVTYNYSAIVVGRGDRTVNCYWADQNMQVTYYSNDGYQSSLVSPAKLGENFILQPKTAFTRSNYSIKAWGKFDRRFDKNPREYGGHPNSSITFEKYKPFISYNAGSSNYIVNLYAEWAGVNENQLTYSLNNNNYIITGASGSGTVATPDYWSNGTDSYPVTGISLGGLVYTGSNTYDTKSTISSFIIGRKITKINEIALLSNCLNSYVVEPLNNTFTGGGNLTQGGTFINSASRMGGFKSGYSDYAPGAFMYASNIGAVTWPINVIKPLMFYKSSISQMTLPNSLNKISSGDYSFNLNNGNTYNVTFKSFYGCTNLVTVNGLNSTPNIWIEDWAFYGCTALKNVQFAKYIQRIDQYAFSNCDLSGTGDNWSQVEEIWNCAFENTKFVSHDYLTINATKLGVNCFNNCGFRSLGLTSPSVVRVRNDSASIGYDYTGNGKNLGNFDSLYVSESIAYQYKFGSISVNDTTIGSNPLFYGYSISINDASTYFTVNTATHRVGSIKSHISLGTLNGKNVACMYLEYLRGFDSEDILYNYCLTNNIGKLFIMCKSDSINLNVPYNCTKIVKTY